MRYGTVTDRHGRTHTGYLGIGPGNAYSAVWTVQVFDTPPPEHKEGFTPARHDPRAIISGEMVVTYHDRD